MGKENKDIPTGDCSLSIDNWIAVLSSEINREQNDLSQITSSVLVIASIVMAVIIYYIKTEDLAMLAVILFVLFLIFLINMGGRRKVIIGRIENLEGIRDYTTFTKYPDTKEICKRWKQYRKFGEK